MTTLSSTELSAMRTAVDGLMPGTAVIHRATLTYDHGRGSASWSAVGTVSCRLAFRGGSSGEEASREAVYRGWVLSVPYGTVVVPGDRVVTGGRTFEVHEVADVQSEAVCRRVYLKEAT